MGRNGCSVQESVAGSLGSPTSRDWPEGKSSWHIFLQVPSILSSVSGRGTEPDHTYHLIPVGSPSLCAPLLVVPPRDTV